MKKLLKFLIVLICSAMLLSSISCVSINHIHHDEGKHKGWYKNHHNPHNPNTSKGKKHTSGRSKKIKIKIE